MLSKLPLLLLLLPLLAFSSNAQALSIGIPKSLIDKAVVAKFPKEKLSVKLENPSTSFSKERQRIELCGNWSSKLAQKSGDFCIDFQPQWNKAKGDIVLSKLNILKLTAGDEKSLPSTLAATLNSTVLTLLDGTSLYHVPDLVGKHLESIELQESSFKLVF